MPGFYLNELMVRLLPRDDPHPILFDDFLATLGILAEQESASGRELTEPILRRFECIYDGETVFAADLHPAISANPYLAFRTVATSSGEMLFRWTDDRGAVREERATIEVT